MNFSKTLSWIDENENLRTVIIDDINGIYFEQSLNSYYYYQKIGKNVNTSDYKKMILDNDFIFTYTYEGKAGTHVTFIHITKRESDNLVLGEGTFINSLLVD